MSNAVGKTQQWDVVLYDPSVPLFRMIQEVLRELQIKLHPTEFEQAAQRDCETLAQYLNKELGATLSTYLDPFGYSAELDLTRDDSLEQVRIDLNCSVDRWRHPLEKLLRTGLQDDITVPIGTLVETFDDETKTRHYTNIMVEASAYQQAIPVTELGKRFNNLYIDRVSEYLCLIELMCHYFEQLPSGGTARLNASLEGMFPTRAKLRHSIPVSDMTDAQWRQGLWDTVSKFREKPAPLF
jgi:hypothetical protein